MIRAPIPDEIALAWWRDALADPPDAIPDDPQCGYFKRRLVKGGIYVPARIWLYQICGEDGELLDDVQLCCEINGAFAEPEDAWSYLCGNPITEAEFNYLTARGEWAARHAPDEPAANPRKPVDWLKVPPPQF